MLTKKTAYKTVLMAFILCIMVLMPEQAFAQQAVTVIDQTFDIYPIDVEEKEENNYGIIIRTYALKPSESPSDIPMNSFSKYGVWYELSEVIKKENRSNETLEHSETISLETASSDMNEILSQLSQEITYEKDGYSGVLHLDLSTVNCEPAGYSTSSYTKNITREYPHLGSSDISLVPKKVSESGYSYDLSDVQFKAQSSNSIDYEQVTTAYTAVATYSRTGSSKNVTGYVTTATYNGEISKVLTDETIYKVYFMSKEPISEQEPEPISQPEPETEIPKIEDDSESVNLLPMVLSLFSLGSVIGIITYLVINSQSTVVYCKENYKYKAIGRLRVDYKAENPTVDLNKLKKTSDGQSFVVEVPKSAMKKILAKPEGKRIVTVHYKDLIKEHAIATYATAEKYQFDISFKETEDDFYEEE